LKAAVFASGRSQRAIAVACGITENRMSEIVRGWIDPGPAEEQVLARELGTSIATLFDERSS
jgi:hypothetical protein